MGRVVQYIKNHKKQVIGIGFLLVSLVVYLLFFRTLTFSPAVEARQMERFEETKPLYQLAPFVGDGCSGNVSKNWQTVVEKMSKSSESFAKAYEDVENIPFEYACTEHDKAYHTGIGGYVGRLRADNELRSTIIEYGIENSGTIQSRTGLGTPEEAIFLYQLLAEAIYNDVRLGGTPCTGESYAWGYGYARGNCESK